MSPALPTVEEARPPVITHLRFESLPQAARRARRVLSEYLGSQGVLRGADGSRSIQSENALTAVTELVTHVCRSTAGSCRLGMLLDQDLLHLEVGDRCDGPRTVPSGLRKAPDALGLGPVGGSAGEWYVVTNSEGRAIRLTLPMRQRGAGPSPAATRVPG